jgi:hypothetical protein
MKTSEGNVYLLDDNDRRFVLNTERAGADESPVTVYWICLDRNCSARAISDKPAADGTVNHVRFKVNVYI